ncbi:transposase [Halobacterium salinarum]|nr:transposase [Halobacterium salinarum]MDL0138545.1 transposase [Halobacterium salinarum]
MRTVKQFSPENLIEGIDQAVGQLTSTIVSEAAFRRPVTVAIDITTVPYYGDVEGMEMVSGVKGEDKRAFKFATLSVVGYNVPLILAVEPVRESSPWDENPSNEMHRIVRRLVQRASQHVPIETVLCDREFDSKNVFQTLSNLNVNYLVPTRRGPTEEDVLEKMTARGEEVAVERARIEVESGSHGCRFLYVPSSSGEGTVVFVTNVDVGADTAVSFCRRYSRRWQIEAEYKSLKSDFLGKTSSKDYRVRLFYFVFAVLLYNVWRVTSFLLQATVSLVEEFEYSPVLTAGECAEVVAAGLDPAG